MTNQERLQANNAMIDEIQETLKNKIITAGGVDTSNLVTKEEFAVLETKVDEVENIAKGANQCKTYGDYQTMIEAFNNMPKDTYRTGQDVRILTLNVPDLWIAYIEETSVPYTYTNDSSFVNELVENGFVQVGYYKFGMLETQKVNLTDYVKNTDYATANKAGVVKISTVQGLKMNDNGELYCLNANAAETAAKETTRRVLTPKYVDYIVKNGLIDNKLEWTEEDKANARKLLGIDTLIEQLRADLGLV